MLRGKKRSKPTAYVFLEAEPEEKVCPDIHIHTRGGRARQAERAHARILMCAVLFLFIFAALIVRLSFVSFGKISVRPTFASVQLTDAPRPELLDRNGVLLATELPMIALEVAGREVWDANETALQLASTIPDIDPLSLEKKLNEGRYVELRTDLTPTERKAVFNLGLPGVRFATRTKRFYPQADLAAHLIGHTEPGKGGVMGLEKTANSWSGSGPIRSTIDIRIQQILEDELSTALEKFSAKAAWGAIMDARTGEVIALASLPDFDPNTPGAFEADFRRNRATYDRYELGSAFKALTAAAAIEGGVANEASMYDARGTYQIADRRISDFHGENRILTLSEVIQYSSNIGIARIASDMGAGQQKKFLKQLGLFEPLSLDIPETRNPDLPAQWGPVETATIAYGHGISVTPLHLLAAFTAVVNDGVYYEPELISNKHRTKTASRRVFSAKTSAVMRRILRRVITDGTAKFAEAPGYYPIGKTATADKPSVHGGYDRNTRIASFVGAIPGYAPRYTILVSLDEPQPLKETFGYATAGWNAAPTFARIVERSAPILGLAPAIQDRALAAFASNGREVVQEAHLSKENVERLQ